MDCIQHGCKRPIEDGDRVMEIKVGNYEAKTEDLITDYRDGFMHTDCFYSIYHDFTTPLPNAES